MVRTWILAAVVLATGAVARSHQHHETGGPISTLTADEVAQLEAGDGMGLARAAELNHDPGPKHALELAAELGQAQTGKVQAIRDRMLADAVRLGAALIDKETTLHRVFANRHVTELSMRALTAEIGTLRGELRATHLAAHLAMADVLTPDQVHRYDERRGYRSP